MKRPAKKPRAIPDPPAVAEVRRARARLVKQAGGTVAGFLALSEKLAASKIAEATGNRRSSPNTKPTPKRRTRAA